MYLWVKIIVSLQYGTLRSFLVPGGCMWVPVLSFWCPWARKETLNGLTLDYIPTYITVHPSPDNILQCGYRKIHIHRKRNEDFFSLMKNWAKCDGKDFKKDIIYF